MDSLFEKSYQDGWAHWQHKFLKLSDNKLAVFAQYADFNSGPFKSSSVIKITDTIGNVLNNISFNSFESGIETLDLYSYRESRDGNLILNYLPKGCDYNDPAEMERIVKADLQGNVIWKIQEGFNGYI